MQRNCWKCGKTIDDPHFCGFCHSLQPPPPNYYDFFSLDHKLNLDTPELERRFYALSRQLHPDVFFRRSEQEQRYSLEATAVLNDAYRTLKDPVMRAEYLLRENGFDVGEQKSSNVPSELLEEVFELNMALEEIRRGEEAARAQLEEAREKFVRMLETVDEDLAAKFAQYDRTGERPVLTEIRGILNRRKYIRNLVDQAGHALATPAASQSV
jgi:molecular chaperone HscB